MRSCSPFLFVLTFFFAIASCSSIWFSRCLSRFCSMSSCDLRPKMAFFGLSFRFCADAPPNQPQTPDMAVVVSKLSITIRMEKEKDYFVGQRSVVRRWTFPTFGRFAMQIFRCLDSDENSRRDRCAR
jgi:hypothetical protein